MNWEAGEGQKWKTMLLFLVNKLGIQLSSLIFQQYFVQPWVNFGFLQAAT